MSTTQRVTCLSCGADLVTAADAQHAQCAYCGTHWRIAQTAGQATLLAADKLGQAVQDAGAATQAGMTRLQKSQELASLRLQLQHVQAEIRSIERIPQTGRTKSQLRDLRSQARPLDQQIAALDAELNPAPPAGPKPPGTLARFFKWRVNIPLRGRLLAVPGFLLVLSFCCLCSITSMITSPSTTRTPAPVGRTNATLTPTATPLPVASPVPPTATRLPPTVTPVPPTATPIPPTRPPATPTATRLPPTAPPVTRGNLPGLQPADVKVNLEERQFKCGSVTQGQTLYTWTCKLETAAEQFTVQIYARTLLTVDYLNVTTVKLVAAPDDSLTAQSLLGFMATMPFDGAQPAAARTWVETTLPTIKQNGDVRTATFGNVPYRLFGNPAARTLQMGALPATP